jgi:hypothetical protein
VQYSGCKGRRAVSSTRLVSASFNKTAEENTSTKFAKKKDTANPKTVLTDTPKTVELKEVEVTVLISTQQKTIKAQTIKKS